MLSARQTDCYVLIQKSFRARVCLKQSLSCLLKPPVKQQMISVSFRVNCLDVVSEAGCRVKRRLQKVPANRLWQRCGPGLIWRRAQHCSGSHRALTEPRLEANLPPWRTNCQGFTVPLKQTLPLSVVQTRLFSLSSAASDCDEICFWNTFNVSVQSF